MSLVARRIGRRMGMIGEIRVVDHVRVMSLDKATRSLRVVKHPSGANEAVGTDDRVDDCHGRHAKADEGDSWARVAECKLQHAASFLGAGIDQPTAGSSDVVGEGEDHDFADHKAGDEGCHHFVERNLRDPRHRTLQLTPRPVESQRKGAEV